MLNDICRKRAGKSNVFNYARVREMVKSLNLNLKHGLNKDDF
jgi:hypothetical protein